MNGGMLHAARPSDSVPKGNFGGLPAEVIAMARQMGLGPDDMKQMGSMWKNMDDLAVKDPDTYKKFTGDILAEGPPEPGGTKAKSFIPTPAFVIKVKVASSGLKVSTLSGQAQKFFINMTSCEALEPPKDNFGRPVEEHDKRSADGLQIPLLVGELRACPDHSGEAASALDAVFHPWVMNRCAEDNTFKAQVIELALRWVEQETNLKFSKEWKPIKSKYKGGLLCGSDDTENELRPFPFPVDRAMTQSDPIDERKEADTESKPPPPINLNTPSDLLRAATNPSDGATAFDMKLPPAGTVGAGAAKEETKSTPLIEEVGGKKKKSAAIKKGFLKPSKPGQAAPQIYDSLGSSGDGGKEGTYSRFMSKCKVVDLNGMSEEQQHAEMEKHAQGPSPQIRESSVAGNSVVDPSASTAPPVAEASEVEAGFESLSRGFLSASSKGGSALYGDEGSPEGGTVSSSGKDPLFDSLIESVDPDYANASQPMSDPESDTAFGSLGAIASFLGGGADAPGDMTQHPMQQLDDFVKMATQVRGIDTDEVIQSNFSTRPSSSNLLFACRSQDQPRIRQCWPTPSP